MPGADAGYSYQGMPGGRSNGEVRLAYTAERCATVLPTAPKTHARRAGRPRAGGVAQALRKVTSERHS